MPTSQFHPLTTFQRVAEMNTAFGNPAGDANNINWSKLYSQCKNILDEYQELLDAIDMRDFTGVRDALCDIEVFTMGAQHIAGLDGDADLHDVITGVMTRFVKDEDDLKATLAKHYAKGVSKVYIEGEFPKMVVKSAVDQPDAPKGKFLKSASYKDTVFRAPPSRITGEQTVPVVGKPLLKHQVEINPTGFNEGSVESLAG